MVGAGSNNEEGDYYAYALWKKGNITCNNSSEKLSAMGPTLTLSNSSNF